MTSAQDQQQHAPYPDAAALEDFRNQVRTWMELDNSIKDLQQQARERRTFKKQLTEKILAFMRTYNIEDLNTKHGRLCYRQQYVRAPLSQAVIRRRMESALSSEAPDRCMQITTAVFSRDRQPTAKLMRLKVSNIP